MSTTIEKGQRDAVPAHGPEDDVVHIVFGNAPNVALCGEDVTSARFEAADAGPECGRCAQIAERWRWLEESLGQ